MKKATLFKVEHIFLALGLALAALLSTQFSPAQAQGDEKVPGQSLPTDQIIVQYKGAPADHIGPTHSDQLERLSAAAGVHLQYFRTMDDGTYVLKLDERLSEQDAQAVVDQLMTLPEVEYAVPDRIFQHTLTPNDPNYASQWHYSGPYGINAPAAWDITTGSASLVVAVVDTGITNHTDLAGRTVAGYDFIQDVFVANDGNGRDSDPSDPGDWITVAESASGYFAGCDVSNSSWHGTHVAGTIGAASNNGKGVAGINWQSKILPVRVLGKCGGYMSDIIDGVKWAAGLPVAGVPANPNPAKVINLSLGGYGACDALTQAAINAVVANGSVVVVSAGNSNDNTIYYSPGNCANVITVAATNKTGGRAYYSNYGSLVKIAAPGGEQYSYNDPNGVLSTMNTGATTPASDTYAYYQGTSMAAPHVTGVVSLMLSMNPYLAPAQTLRLLQGTAMAFPAGSSCNTSSCGSGIVNAYAAVYTAAHQPTFVPASKWSPAFDQSRGWTVQNHVRTTADVNNDGRADLIGFGLDGVYVALSNGSGFNPVSQWLAGQFDQSHGWTVQYHVRSAADVNGDGRADLIGFGLDGVYVALSNGTKFETPTKWLADQFDQSHGWTVQYHVRTAADVNNDGRADLIGFGLDGVYVALSTGSGFGTPTKWLNSAFDQSHGWTVQYHVRLAADVNGDGRADLIGFGLDGVYVALSNGTKFETPTKWLADQFDQSHGWTVQYHVRTVADINNDGRADLIGFGLDGVYVALSNGTSFGSASLASSAFDQSHGWTVQNHIRSADDVNGDGRADLIGFGLDGVYVGLAYPIP